MIDLVLNESMQFQIIEQLPKEKTALVATGALNFGRAFIPFEKISPFSDKLPEEPPVKFEGAVSFALEAGIKGKEDQEPNIKVEMNLSKPLVSAENLHQGRFLSFSSGTLLPCPDEWTTKDATEKDPLSSMPALSFSLNTYFSDIYNYSLDFKLPGVTKVAKLKAGRLRMMQYAGKI
jgi:hypothetical protein